MPTARRGRTYQQVGANDKSGINAFCSVIFIVLLLTIPPIILLASERSRYTRYITLSDALNSDVVELNEKHNMNEQSLRSIPPGTLVHGTSTSINTLATDPDTNINIPGALSLRRNTEYCQWQEISSQHCQTCERTVKARDGSTKEEKYQCNCITQYNYIKGWKNYKINSLLFDQPGAHHNPQRDPLPSRMFVGDDVTVRFHEDVSVHEDTDEDSKTDKKDLASVTSKLDGNMLSSGVRNQPWRQVDFVPHGVAPPPSFISRILSFFGRSQRVRYEPLQLLKDTTTSQAAIQDNFVYVGQGGYFFSPYESSTASKLFNYFAQYLEGSLFDYQMGDLIGLGSCTAGDIRFKYSVQDPREISVLGQLRKVGDSGEVQITPRLLKGLGNEKDSSIGLVHSGRHSAEDMLLAEDSDSLLKAVVIRVILFVWAIAASRVVGAAFGREIGESSLAVQFEAAVGLFSTFVGGLWAYIWGMSSIETLGCITTGLYLAYLSYNSAAKKGRGRWYTAVWSKIGQWANVAPEWRKEDSYIPSPKSVGEGERAKMS